LKRTARTPVKTGSETRYFGSVIISFVSASIVYGRF